MKHFFFFSFFLLVLNIAAFAQIPNESEIKTYPSASMTKEYYLQLSVEKPNAKSFLIDYNALALRSDSHAEHFFGKFSDANVKFQLIPVYRWAIVNLVPADAEKANWTALEWNEYFKVKLQKQRETEGYFIDKTKGFNQNNVN